MARLRAWTLVGTVDGFHGQISEGDPALRALFDQISTMADGGSRIQPECRKWRVARHCGVRTAQVRPAEGDTNHSLPRSFDLHVSAYIAGYSWTVGHELPRTH